MYRKLTFNNAAENQHAVDIDINNVASGSDSSLMRFTVNGIEKYRVGLDGSLQPASGAPFSIGPAPTDPAWQAPGINAWNEFSTSSGHNFYDANATGYGPSLTLGYWRGTVNVPVIVQTDDQLAQFAVASNDGAGLNEGWSTPFTAQWLVVGTPAVGSIAVRSVFAWSGGASSKVVIAVNASNAGVVDITTGSLAVTAVGSYIKTGGQTVAQLPAAATAGIGARAFVTDALTTVILGLGTNIAAGGSNKVPVYSDGTNWKYG
jgi:hypothetical protein